MTVTFAVLGVAGIQAWEQTNSVAFCSDACHDVHPEEPAAYQDSYHARVTCTECHMGRVGTLQAMWLKVGHSKDLPLTLLKRYERPVQSATLRPANQTCERCHSPSTFHGDRVREIRHFQSDPDNTERRTHLILKTGTGKRENAPGYGIHWHIQNPVEYIAVDPQKQDIRWVRTTLPDGRVVEYNDALRPLSPEEIAKADKRTMDCVDCHNRSGHPFPSPARALDDALASNRLDQSLPFAKQELLALLTATYPDRQSALDAPNKLLQRYQVDHPQVVAEQQDAIGRAARLAGELMPLVNFEAPGLNWRTFPDNAGHRDFPGCFRCHDGKHVSADGESIRLHCNICHNIPVVRSAGDGPPQALLAPVSEPDSHWRTNFIAEHRSMVNDSCQECHGPIAYGRDDSSFCANSACHGQTWPALKLTQTKPHPIPLEGKHAQVRCEQCHSGTEKPVQRCANCHQPPSQPHFGDECEKCHSPAGFEGAAAPADQHPIPLEGKHAQVRCEQCHAGAEKPVYRCANCHQPPSRAHFGDECEKCHTPAGFQSDAAPAGLHPFPLEGAHATADCSACHVEGKTLSKACNGCHQPPSQPHLGADCQTCHNQASFKGASLPRDRHPIKLQGAHAQAACESCHGGDKTPSTRCSGCHQPPSQPHFGADCQNCHSQDTFKGTEVSRDQHPIPLTGAHSRASCESCHAKGTPKYVCSNCHSHPGEDHPDRNDCQSCHDTDGWGGAEEGQHEEEDD